MKLIVITFLCCLFAAPAFAELRNGMDADVVIGAPDFNTIDSSVSAHTTGTSTAAPVSDGQRLIVSAFHHSRVLIYNTIPTQNGAAADAVIGQAGFGTSTTHYPDGTNRTNNLELARGIAIGNGQLFVCSRTDTQVKVFDPIPETNVFPSAKFVLSAAGVGEAAGVSADNRRLAIYYSFGTAKVEIYDPIPTSADAVPVANVTGMDSGAVGGGVSIYQNYLFIVERSRNRVLVWNNIPSSNTTVATADVIIGQKDLSSTSANQGGGLAANTLSSPTDVFYSGKYLLIADAGNNRILVYEDVPTVNNAPADYVLGQTDFTSSSSGTSAGKFNAPHAASYDGRNIYVSDFSNSRVLIFHVGGQSTNLSPQFTQGKALVGKVFWDKDGNGEQDPNEEGLAGVRVVSDTGIYAITDEEGKYHYPYIETGQRVLKIDSSTLPDGLFAPEPLRKVLITEGVFSKVSFGIQGTPARDVLESVSQHPLLKVSVSEDPIRLQKHLQVSFDAVSSVFSITCNYRSFIDKAELTLFDEDMKPLQQHQLPFPLPYTYPYAGPRFKYFQINLFDKSGNRDSSSIVEI